MSAEKSGTVSIIVCIAVISYEVFDYIGYRETFCNVVLGSLVHFFMMHCV